MPRADVASFCEFAIGGDYRLCVCVCGVVVGWGGGVSKCLGARLLDPYTVASTV